MFFGGGFPFGFAQPHQEEGNLQLNQIMNKKIMTNLKDHTKYFKSKVMQLQNNSKPNSKN